MKHFVDARGTRDIAIVSYKIHTFRQSTQGLAFWKSSWNVSRIASSRRTVSLSSPVSRRPQSVVVPWSYNHDHELRQIHRPPTPSTTLAAAPAPSSFLLLVEAAMLA